EEDSNMIEVGRLTREKVIERWENCLRVLQNLTPHQRKRHWNMARFGYKNECGTVACAAGHCGLDTWFRRRGLKLDFKRYSNGIVTSTMKGYEVELFFGILGSSR